MRNEFPICKDDSWLHRLGLLAIILLSCNARVVPAQIPSPLQERQYSGGVISARLFEPDLSRFWTALGLATQVQPVYDGSHA
jgi:hypothetical protein